MGIFGSIKKGFSVSASSLPVVLLLFIFGFIFNLINIALNPATPTASTPPTPAMVAVGFIFVLLTIFMQSGSMGYVRNKIKSSAAFSDFFGTGVKYYVKVLVLSLIMAVVIGIFVLLAALAVSALGESMKIVAAVVAVLTACIGIFILVLLFFAPYIVVNEEAGVIASLKSSVSLVRANLLKVFTLAILLIVIGFAVGMVIGLAVGFASRSMPPTTAKILFAFLSSLINAFLGLFVTASFMSFYLSRSSAPEAGTAQHL